MVSVDIKQHLKKNLTTEFRSCVNVDVDDLAISLVSNLKASAKGWGNPAKPTLFGPLRICIYLNSSYCGRKAAFEEELNDRVQELCER